MKQSDNKSREKKKKVIQPMFLFDFFVCMYVCNVKEHRAIIQEISLNPPFNPRNVLNSHLCVRGKLMVFPGVRASVGVPAGYWAP